MSWGVNLSQERVRVTGNLTTGGRGPVVIAEDGSVWVLDYDDELEHLIDSAVTAEGEVTGLNRLRADWVGPFGNGEV